MHRLMQDFSGDYRVLRVMWATADPLRTLDDLHTVYSYRRFVQFLEYLDAKTTLDEDSAIRERKKMEQMQQQKGSR